MARQLTIPWQLNKDAEVYQQAILTSVEASITASLKDNMRFYPLSFDVETVVAEFSPNQAVPVVVVTVYLTMRSYEPFASVYTMNMLAAVLHPTLAALGKSGAAAAVTGLYADVEPLAPGAMTAMTAWNRRWGTASGDALVLMPTTPALALRVPFVTEVRVEQPPEYWASCSDVETAFKSNKFDIYDFFQDPIPIAAATFTIQASNDAHIAFAPNIAAGESVPLYEIVIGGWANTQSVIRRSSQGANLATAATPNILSKDESRPFWASVVDGQVRVGRGSVIGVDVFMQYDDPDPLPIQYLGINTGWGSNGHWHVCAVTEQRIPSGNEVRDERSPMLHEQWGRIT